MTEKFCKIAFHIRAKTLRTQARYFSPLYDVFGPMVIPYVVYLKKIMHFGVGNAIAIYQTAKNSTRLVGFHVTQASIWHYENQRRNGGPS